MERTTNITANHGGDSTERIYDARGIRLETEVVVSSSKGHWRDQEAHE